MGEWTKRHTSSASPHRPPPVLALLSPIILACVEFADWCIPGAWEEFYPKGNRVRRPKVLCSKNVPSRSHSQCHMSNPVK